MPVTHEPWLVGLSLIVAIQGAYVGLSLAVQVGAAIGLRRRLLLAAAAISLALAIWAMHFVAMLAARLPTAVDYLVLPTLLSFLVCVIVVGTGVFAASLGPLTTGRLAAAAAFMGSGIVSMHYIGMTALHASAHLTHEPALVAASVVIAVATCGLALWFAAGHGGRFPLLLSATALGFAIAGMHYTAMAGLAIFPHSGPWHGAPALSADLLAIVVAVVAFLVSCVFLLALVPDRSSEQPSEPVRASTAGDPEPALAAPPAFAHAPAAPSPGHDGGSPVAARERVPPAAPARRLPVQRDGGTHFVPVEDIVAVHANAHYTYVFDGTSKLFCPLAISDVEARLDSSRFVRVHRSHIVNIDRIVLMRRAGDNGIVELAAADRYTVPVSRGRFGGLKSRLAPTLGEAVG